MDNEAPYDDSLDDDNVRYLCHACCHPNDPNAHFCEKCGVALGDTATIDPIKRIYAMGEMFRGIVNRKNPATWILIGAVLVVLEWLLLPYLYLPFTGFDSPYDVLAFGLALLPALYAIAVLYRVGKNAFIGEDYADPED